MLGTASDHDRKGIDPKPGFCHEAGLLSQRDIVIEWMEAKDRKSRKSDE
jgi:hypothetical protein